MSAPDAALLESYLVRTRWFGGKGRPFDVEQVRSVAEVPAQHGGPSLTVFLVTVVYRDQDAGSEVYQVPLSGYDEMEERIGHAYVGAVGTESGPLHLYDAVHDREAMRIWLDGFIAAEATGTAQVDRLRFHRVPGGGPLDNSLVSAPMTGEQSNSSARFDDTAIMKLFRKLSPGINPDIEIHEELTRGGSEHIAQLYGWVEIDVDGQLLQTAMLQEFLATATDGFELAVASVRTLLADPQQRVEDSGGDFAGEAARLGEALASVHALMRSRFPAGTRGGDTAAHLAHAMRGRLEEARRSVPGLETHVPQLLRLYDAVAALDGLDVQRVHGDLHLGQTLRTSHGWRIVDFEGEPGRPFAQRSLPDSPWRDVAGMLRSFDYAAAMIEMSWATDADTDEGQALRAERAREWSARAREYFVAAYVAAISSVDGSEGDPGIDLTGPERVLLDAYVADKAVYEVMYEIRNRPTWVSIPLEALERVATS
ncbi:phosphotransferase [Microbacterium sp. NPDC076895]|uniref:maltokinase N-terminal cap-like domain-containing protein n=1 Tax=Microbacterium sp. NPDC076895 TaxID=3154957 RepID=UPI0034337D76